MMTVLQGRWNLAPEALCPIIVVFDAADFVTTKGRMPFGVGCGGVTVVINSFRRPSTGVKEDVGRGTFGR
jgi:hypothetical protein